LGTLMRHFLMPGTVLILAFSVFQTATIAPLIALSSGYQRCLPGTSCTSLAAIDIAPVTVAADDDLAVTTGTVVKTGGVLHRRLWPMRTGLKGKSDKYLSGSCSARLLGCGIGGLSRSIHSVPHLLNGPLYLPGFFLDVTLFGRLFLLPRYP
jgi:hypothetical protein